ncbi:hypothetical protein QQ045_031384 [Rhodiola kirilowii]
MAEYFNEKSEISGCIPVGSFNANFKFSGSWQIDAAATKSIAMIGSFIRLYKVNLVNHILVLKDEVKRVVPYSWDRNLVCCSLLVGSKLGHCEAYIRCRCCCSLF